MIPVSFMLSFYILGWSVVSGVAVVAIACPWMYAISKLSAKYIKEQTAFKDKRLNLMNEIIAGIRIIKMYAWEDSFIGKVLQTRNLELKCIRNVMVVNAFWRLTTTMLPFLVSLVTFTTFVYLGKHDGSRLTADKAFSSITLFEIMKFPVVNVPLFINAYFYYQVSAKRVSRFLNSKDLQSQLRDSADLAVSRKQQPKADSAENIQKKIPGSVRIEFGYFSWVDGKKISVSLRNINLSIPKGRIVAIIGRVGSGKSSLLSAITGEIEKSSGLVEVFGRLGFVPQQAWIQNKSFRDNILFGNPYQHEKYKTILRACALESDIKLLPSSDQTEIGEKGINLSGGQKQRVSLARAVYDDSDVYLLDDPLSAVDAHVSKHIFDCVIGPNSLLKDKVLFYAFTHIYNLFIFKFGVSARETSRMNLSIRYSANRRGEVLLENMWKNGDVIKTIS